MCNPNDFGGDMEDEREYPEEPDYDDEGDGPEFEDEDDDFDDDFDDDGSPEAEDRARCREFANPYGNSALRAASASNPRNLPCPNCGAANRLTPKDAALGYQCDPCADRDERGGY